MKTSTQLKLLTAVSAIGMSSALLWADSISPSSVSASIDVGNTVTIEKTVTVSAGAPTTSKVDVFFLADNTGSMGSAIGTVKASAASILASAAGLGDVAFGVGAYNDFSDIPTRQPYEQLTNITTSQSTALNAINSWAAYYGGDWEEANLYALTQVADTTTWRAGSERMVVIFGDAPGHDPSGGATLASTIAALNAMNVSVLAVDVGELNYGGQALAYTSGTGGLLVTGIDNSTIVAAISSAISTSVSNYSSVGLDWSEAPAGVTVSPITPITGTFDRSVDHTFDFTVTITGDAPGTYDFPIYATVDGGRVATETDHIVVGGSSVPDGGTSILLLGLALSGLALIRRLAGNA